MAWQSVPSLLIIGGAFNAAAGLLWGLDRLYYGRDRRILRDQFSYGLECRDYRVMDYRKKLAQQAKEAETTE